MDKALATLCVVYAVNWQLYRYYFQGFVQMSPPTLLQSLAYMKNQNKNILVHIDQNDEFYAPLLTNHQLIPDKTFDFLVYANQGQITINHYDHLKKEIGISNLDSIFSLLPVYLNRVGIRNSILKLQLIQNYKMSMKAFQIKEIVKDLQRLRPETLEIKMAIFEGVQNHSFLFILEDKTVVKILSNYRENQSPFVDQILKTIFQQIPNLLKKEIFLYEDNIQFYIKQINTLLQIDPSGHIESISQVLHKDTLIKIKNDYYQKISALQHDLLVGKVDSSLFDVTQKKF